MVDPVTVTLAGGATKLVKDANEKSKWCKCGHKHPRKGASKSRHKRQALCVESGCGCPGFRTQASDAEVSAARAWGKSRMAARKGLKKSKRLVKKHI